MAKMFYTAEEAAQRLGKSEDDIKAMVRAGELREFRDGDQLNYRVDEIDGLADSASGGSSVSGGDSAAGASGTSEIILEPAEDSGDASAISGSDILSLEEVAEEELDGTGGGTSAGTKAAKKKGSTVVPSIGVNVFDDDDFDEAVDPLAQTAVTDVAGLGMEGSGSGSGILDLTRESDDTSLGAELLEEIYSEDEGGSGSDAAVASDDTRAGLAVDDSGVAAAVGEDLFEPEAQGAPVPGPMVTRVEYGPDAVSTGLTALMGVAVVVMWFAGLAGAALVSGTVPSILKGVYANLSLYAGCALGVGLIAAALTYFIAKRSGT